jgi:hypothetical protein
MSDREYVNARLAGTGHGFHAVPTDSANRSPGQLAALIVSHTLQEMGGDGGFKALKWQLGGLGDLRLQAAAARVGRRRSRPMAHARRAARAFGAAVPQRIDE